MKNILLFIKNKAEFLGVIVVAAVVGGATTAVVSAAIPDSNGQVNACYKNSTQVLRVTDPAGNCTSNETALSWSQTGPQGPAGTGGPVAYAHVYTDGSGNMMVDTANSLHVTNAYLSPHSYVCFDFDSTVVNPHLILANPESPSSAGNTALANVSPGSSLFSGECNSGAGALADIGGQSGFIVVY